MHSQGWESSPVPQSFPIISPTGLLHHECALPCSSKQKRITDAPLRQVVSYIGAGLSIWKALFLRSSGPSEQWLNDTAFALFVFITL